jgi:RNA polymerase sigma-70 factor, ECF subfamily
VRDRSDDDLTADESINGDPSEREFGDIREQILRAVSRICPGWLAANREDIVQSAILRLLRLRNRRERTAPYPASYLYKVAYTAMIDEIRRLRTDRTLPMDLETADPPAVDGRSDPDRLLASHQLGAGIQECLTRMDQRKRQAVTLYLIGHGTPDIARLLGWNAKRVENYVYRGLGDLRGCLRSKGLAIDSSK